MKKHKQLHLKAKYCIQLSQTYISPNEIFEIFPICTNKFVFLDIGNYTQTFFFLYSLPKKNILSVHMKIQSLTTMYNSILFHKNTVLINSFLYIYFRIFIQKKTLIRGFFLNKTKYFIIVGFLGFSGIILKKELFYNSKIYQKYKTILFTINTFDFQKKQFIGSQKDLIRKTNKILLRLASRLVFVFKYNR